MSVEHAPPSRVSDPGTSDGDRRDEAEPNRPLVTALVCTRNRGDQIVQTITSILANDHPSFELLIVDQSTDDKCEAAVRGFASDPRLRYFRTPTKGLGLARDIGIREARADYVAITDDDCEVQPDWLTEIARAFDEHPAVAVIYCDVKPGPHDYTQGCIPHFLIPKTRLVPRLRISAGGDFGIGAGMAVRRHVVLSLGGSDHMLGAGTSLPANEDIDLGFRALLAGHSILQLGSATVTHHGYRTFPEYSQLLGGYLAGAAGMHVKLLRCGHWRALTPFLHLIYVTILVPTVVSIASLKKPRVLRRLLGIVRGSYTAMRFPVDKRDGVFHSSYVHPDGVSRTRPDPVHQP